jgi:superfamily II DNA or RNA helicase
VTVLDLLRPLTSIQAQHRALEYMNRVRTLEGDTRRVIAEVRGSDVYDIEMAVEHGTLRIACSCPHFIDQRTVCKHLWATGLVAEQRGWLSSLPSSLRVEMDVDDYDFVDDLDLEGFAAGRYGDRRYPRRLPPVPRVVPELQGPRRQHSAPPEWSVVLAGLGPESADRPVSVWAGAQLIYVIAAPAGATITELPLVVERQERKKNGEWSKPQASRLTFDAIPHLPDADDRWALSLIHAASSFPRDAGGYGYGLNAQPLGPSYLRSSIVDLLLPRLCGTGRVRVRHVAGPYAGSAPVEGDATLAWEDGEPWRFELVVTPTRETGTEVAGSGDGGRRGGGDGGREGGDGGRRRDGDGGREGGDGGGQGCGDGGREGGDGGRQSTEMEDATAYRVDALLRRGEEQVDIGDFELLTDSVAIRNNHGARFDPAGGFAWAVALRRRGAVVVPGDSRRALIDALVRSGVEHVGLPDELRWEERAIAPRFRINIGAPTPFGACPVEATVEYETVRAPIGVGSRLIGDDGRVVFRRDRAAEQTALATLKRLSVVGLEPHLRIQPSVHERRLPSLVQALVADRWTVEAEGVRYRAVVAPRLRIQSGIDWFELKAVGDSTDTPIDIADLLKALSSGRRTVLLGDGSIGMLPEEWLARVAPALSIGVAGEESIRFKPSQVALIDALLATRAHVDWDEGFTHAREALKQFDGVRPEDAADTFTGSLRDYQREALGWMRFLRNFSFGGCLADDMGLGKTVMVLAMLDARRHDASRPHRPSLIVLPRSLLFNWMNEAARFTPALAVLDFAYADRHSAADEIARVDLVLTTYGTLRRDVAMLKDHVFDYVVLDEAQAIKNANTATAKAARLLRGDHRLALSGTPVENHLGELQSLFDFLNPGLLGKGRLLDAGARGARGPRGATGATGATGAGDEVTATTVDDDMKRLARGLRPFFLRRTKEQVAPELPPRTEETLYCELEGEQRTLYEQLREHYRRVLLKMIDRVGLAKSRFQVLEALLRLRQAACHTGLLTSAAARTGGVARPMREGSAKFDVLLPRLSELVAEGRKALVFSQFTSLLTLLRAKLDDDGVAYEYLDGHTTNRQTHVERFQTDAACPLFLISLKAGGVGLNLTAAEYVFLLDPWWNPAVEMQAIDRTHRIGQVKPVFAYRLVARQTVEERILELQSRKRELADAILDAGGGGLRGLEREDLEHLLA